MTTDYSAEKRGYFNAQITVLFALGKFMQMNLGQNLDLKSINLEIDSMRYGHIRYVSLSSVTLILLPARDQTSKRFVQTNLNLHFP